MPPKSVLQCNVLIGADGQNSNVAKLFNFERKVFKGSEAIGITANFLNKQSKAEISLNEFGLMSVYNKPVRLKRKRQPAQPNPSCCLVFQRAERQVRH